MFAFISSRLALIDIQVFLSSILLFMIGYAFAPTAYFKNIRWLLAYPLWVAKKLEKWSKRDWNPYALFGFIFLLNAASLFINLLSGFIPLLPVLFAIWTGLNVGTVSYHMLKGRFYFASLFNPVSIFELPAAFLSFTMAMQYNIIQLNLGWFSLKPVAFLNYMQLFLATVLPLLVISGIIESALIKYAQKFEDMDDKD